MSRACACMSGWCAHLARSRRELHGAKTAAFVRVMHRGGRTWEERHQQPGTAPQPRTGTTVAHSRDPGYFSRKSASLWGSLQLDFSGWILWCSADLRSVAWCVSPTWTRYRSVRAKPSEYKDPRAETGCRFQGRWEAGYHGTLLEVFFLSPFIILTHSLSGCFPPEGASVSFKDCLRFGVQKTNFCHIGPKLS